MIKIKITIFLLLFTVTASAQHEKNIIEGKVYSKINKETIPGAFVRWMEKESGIFTDDKGAFKIEHHHESPFLVISFASYKTDTIQVKDLTKPVLVFLTDDNELAGATVIGRKLSYGLSKLSPRTTVLLGEREFQKAACCNLSESFENAPAIDVSFSDAVTGTKQIKMLGLDGFYTMIGREYMPAVRTLNSYYGLSLIPSAWVSGIQITKGAGSVVNGYESMAGQINIEMKKPFGKENFLLDQFVSQGGRAETDLMYRKDINMNLATSVFARAAINPLQNDRNNDGFLDMPMDKQIQFLNRWQFANEKGYEGQLGIGLNMDEKNGGQTSYYNKTPSGYGIGLNTQQFDVFAKLGKAFKENPAKSFGSQYAFNNTQFNGTYGFSEKQKNYVAEATNVYVNLMFQNLIGNSFHTYQTGLSLNADRLVESYDGYVFNRDEIVPGTFFEYTYKPKETFSLVAGVRTDYNSIYGWSVTPRIHSKYRFNKDKTAFRASVGAGRRTSNPLAQNQQIFISNRKLAFPENNWNLPYGLQQEVALNYGLSFEHEMRLSYMPATIGLDYFNTTFLQEVVFDREIDEMAKFYNMENGTRANSFQTQLDLQPARRTEIRLAYRMFDVETKYKDFGYLAKPFISKHRSFINVTQKTRNRWQFSSTATWYGTQRIAGTVLENATMVSDYSPNFILINAQISKTFKNSFELYIGGENLLNYTQENPIQEASSLESPNFDAGLVWGPVFGRMIYGGFRWRIKS